MIQPPLHHYFERKMIFGAGVGHHSPIGGYLENEDLVFVLDVNRDTVHGLWSARACFDAMNTWDGDKKRGIVADRVTCPLDLEDAQ